VEWLALCPLGDHATGGDDNRRSAVPPRTAVRAVRLPTFLVDDSLINFPTLIVLLISWLLVGIAVLLILAAKTRQIHFASTPPRRRPVGRGPRAAKPSSARCSRLDGRERPDVVCTRNEQALPGGVSEKIDRDRL
jgi:hypothetical protein